MGIAGKLFFLAANSDDLLASRIKPSGEQYESQMERWNDLRDHLVEELQRKSGCSIYSWLQGSYKFGTQIRPARMGQEYDIDLGIYFVWSGSPNDGVHEPDDLRDFVQETCSEYVALETNDATRIADLKPRCSRVHFDEDFHIDVPSYHLDRNRDVRALAAENNKWEESDPKAIYKWWKENVNDAIRPLARRVVRYLKMWCALAFEGYDFLPSSIMITVLVAQAFANIDLEEELEDDDTLYSVLHLLQDRLRSSSRVGNPVYEIENLNRLSETQMSIFMTKLNDFVSIAGRALSAPSSVIAAEIWSEIFEHFFPVPSNDEADDEITRSQISESRAVAVIRFNPQIEVEAKVGNRIVRGINRIGPIPKGCSLTFWLVNVKEMPAGCSIVWTVRNSGTEAEKNNDLGHIKTMEGIEVSEETAYKGVHHMDVAVKLQGQLIGRRRVPVEITGLGTPVRNPRRPAWTRLR